MVAPQGFFETASGYPIIDPDTINPQQDWPNGQQAQADWLDTHSILSFATKTELDIKRPTMPPASTGFAYVRGTNTLYSWTGSEWAAVWTLAAPAWTVNTMKWLNGGPTELATGNGTKTSRYQKVGRTVHWNFYIARGSTSNVGTTQYHFELPVAASNYLLPSGVGLVSATTTEQLVMQLINSTTAVLIRPNGSRLSHDSFAWDAGHAIRASMTYESAS